MFKRLTLLFFISLLILIACNQSKNTELNIRFSNDYKNIVVANIDKSGYNSVEEMFSRGDTIENLISVIRLANELDANSKEIIVEGSVHLINGTAMFTPKEDFLVGESYLISTVFNMRFGNLEEFLKQKGSYRLKPQIEILHR